MKVVCAPMGIRAAHSPNRTSISTARPSCEVGVLPVHLVIKISRGRVASSQYCHACRRGSTVEEAGLARMIFVNKMDRENANFARTVEQLKSRFGSGCVPLVVPVGAQKEFQGVVDLMAQKYYAGDKKEAAEIPASVKDEVNSYRGKMIEAIAEVDDKLIEKYLGGEELSPDEIKNGLIQAVGSGKLVPMLAGSALLNMGISQLLDAICQYLPSSDKRKETAEGEDKPLRSVPMRRSGRWCSRPLPTRMSAS